MKQASLTLGTTSFPDSPRVHVFEFPSVGSSDVVTIVAFGDISVEHIRGPLVRIQSRCLFGELLGADDCDCKEQLQMATVAFAEEGAGVLVYLEQEGRGAGAFVKAQAYELGQGLGIDTVEAYSRLGVRSDIRNYDHAADAMLALGLRKVRLLTNNPLKLAGLREAGLEVDRMPLRTEPTDANRAYLRVKQEKLGHLLDISPPHGPDRS